MFHLHYNTCPTNARMLGDSSESVEQWAALTDMKGVQAAKAASKEKRQHSPVSLSFYPCALRGMQQFPPLNLSQPVSEPYAKTLRTLYSPDARGQLGAQRT